MSERTHIPRPAIAIVVIVTIFIITTTTITLNIIIIIISDVLRYGSRIDAQSSDVMNGALAMESQQVMMVNRTMHLW